MDDMTFVYFEDPDAPKRPFLDLQLAFIQNDSKSNLVKVKSRELAKQLKMEPGKFYCYYKPSFANYNYEKAPVSQSYEENGQPQFEQVSKYPTVADQLLNGKYMDEFALNEDFIASEEFQSALEENDFMLTGPLLDSMFDRAFSHRTFNV